MLNNNDQAQSLFEFVSDHSDVEWGLSSLAYRQYSEGNILTTTHLYAEEYGGYEIFKRFAKLPIEEVRYLMYQHSHTNGSLPSNADFNLSLEIKRYFLLQNFGFISPANSGRHHHIFLMARINGLMFGC